MSFGKILFKLFCNFIILSHLLITICDGWQLKWNVMHLKVARHRTVVIVDSDYSSNRVILAIK